MILADVQECTAAANHAFQLASQTFLVLVMWKFTAQSVKISTIRDPNIKAVSFYLQYKHVPLNSNAYILISCW